MKFTLVTSMMAVLAYTHALPALEAPASDIAVRSDLHKRWTCVDLNRTPVTKDMVARHLATVLKSIGPNDLLGDSVGGDRGQFGDPGDGVAFLLNAVNQPDGKLVVSKVSDIVIGITEILDNCPGNLDGSWNVVNGNGDLHIIIDGLSQRDDWADIKCDNMWIADASQDQTMRWQGVDADGAWSAALDFVHTSSNGQSFSEALSNFFHGPEGMQCASTSDHNGCDEVFTCTDFQNTGAAAYFVMGSITAIEAGILNIYDAISRVESGISTNIAQFTNDFSPVISELDGLKIALDILSIGYSLAVAPAWNSWLKGFSFFKKGNSLGTLKDSTNPVVTNSLTLIKDGSVSGQVLQEQNDLSSTLAQLTKVWYNTVDALNQKLFDGSDDSIQTLTDMMSDGKLLERGSPVSDPDIQKYLESAIFSMLIPEAWGYAKKFPFILDSESPCGTINPLTHSGSLDDDIAEASWACVDGGLYYLLTPVGQAEDCGGGDGAAVACYPNSLQAPPGLEKLGGNTYGSIKREDLIASAVRGYKNNGNANGWSLPDTSDAQTVSDLYDYGVQTPGIVRLPVCNLDKALDNWVKHGDESGKPDYYPCN